MSVVATKRSYRISLMMSVLGGVAEVAFEGRLVAF
jgi:hypothetical protein